jgi:hypothetical protein
MWLETGEIKELVETGQRIGQKQAKKQAHLR